MYRNLKCVSIGVNRSGKSYFKRGGYTGWSERAIDITGKMEWEKCRDRIGILWRILEKLSRLKTRLSIGKEGARIVCGVHAVTVLTRKSFKNAFESPCNLVPRAEISFACRQFFSPSVTHRWMFTINVWCVTRDLATCKYFPSCKYISLIVWNCRPFQDEL